MMDSGSYEKLSIRESAASLKKYGSTSKHVNRNEHYLKHYVSNSDTLQGIALKYNVTIEQIRRANKLWASDSLFLREYLSIPSNNAATNNVQDNTPISSSSNASSDCSIMLEDDNIDEFLNKIDASIALTREDIRKSTRNSEFAALHMDSERRRTPISRMKQIANNNSTSPDVYQALPSTLIVQQEKKVRTSLKHHEQQQDELFKL